MEKSYYATAEGIQLISEAAPKRTLVVEGPIDSISLYAAGRYICLISLYDGGSLAFQAESLKYRLAGARLTLYLQEGKK